MSLADDYDLVILDLDGVVYLGTQAVPHAVEAIGALVTPVAYATNNASRRPSEVVDLLGSLGVRATPEQVVTSAGATAELLAGDLPPGAPILVVGADALRDELSSVGLRPVGRAEERPVAVVQGFGPKVGWIDLVEACVAIRQGARWIATNVDSTMPSPRGPVPGNGSLVAAVATALGGRRPDVIVGKPEPALFDATVRRAGATRALVVGDRLDTDIAGALAAGLDSLLVLTGVSTRADVERAGTGHRPTYVAADLMGLLGPAEASRLEP